MGHGRAGTSPWFDVQLCSAAVDLPDRPPPGLFPGCLTSEGGPAAGRGQALSVHRPGELPGLADGKVQVPWEVGQFRFHFAGVVGREGTGEGASPWPRDCAHLPVLHAPLSLPWTKGFLGTMTLPRREALIVAQVESESGYEFLPGAKSSSGREGKSAPGCLGDWAQFQVTTDPWHLVGLEQCEGRRRTSSGLCMGFPGRSRMGC